MEDEPMTAIEDAVFDEIWNRPTLIFHHKSDLLPIAEICCVTVDQVVQAINDLEKKGHLVLLWGGTELEKRGSLVIPLEYYLEATGFNRSPPGGRPR